MGHYTRGIIAIDPHRIISTTKRVMPEKKKQPNEPSGKLLQTFFGLGTGLGQPIGFGMGSPGVNTTKATIRLLNIVALIEKMGLIIADKEHFTNELARYMKLETQFGFVIPVINSKRIQKIERSLDFQPLWAGYAIAETPFRFARGKEEYRLLVQREGEAKLQYRSFLALSDLPASKLLTEIFVKRRSIEGFFNFDGAISVKDDTILVTCYDVPKELKLQQHYQKAFGVRD
ncbi:MAG: hypothetical protein B6I19_10200 [Bacteroidetes bacterium 4572_114]|nr:MAG: hypothetical protein B6I19_10200 [Bacteroidetes bacterium 4572_114]